MRYGIRATDLSLACRDSTTIFWPLTADIFGESTISETSCGQAISSNGILTSCFAGMDHCLSNRQ